MWIEIKNDIFQSESISDIQLLVNLALKRPSTGKFSKADLFVYTSKVENLVTYQNLDPNIKEHLETLFNASITESVTYKHTVSNNNPIKNLSIDEAIEIIKDDIYIVLENDLNDAYLIEVIIQNFDKNSKLKEFLENKWIKFENGGGCTNVKNTITRKLSNYSHLPKDPKYYFNCIVFLDSDKSFPTDTGKHDKLIKYLNSEDVLYHIYEKRAMENYIPDEVLMDIKNIQNTTWIDAYRSLSPIQKDFIHFSDGFKLETLEHHNLEIQEHYSSLSATNYQFLKTGIDYPHFKREFPKLFKNHHHSRKDTLLKRISHHEEEFEKIISKLEKLL